MSTGYAVFRIDPDAIGHPRVRITQIFWRHQQAVELVERLNALAMDSPGSYSWLTVWVAPRSADAQVTLTPKDHEYLERARILGALDTDRPLGVFFSFPFNVDGARKTCEELRSLGWPDAGYDEELTGDECWHVYAHQRRLALNAESILRLRTEMEALAERYGGTFDGWDVSGGRGLRWAEAGDLPT